MRACGCALLHRSSADVFPSVTSSEKPTEETPPRETKWRGRRPPRERSASWQRQLEWWGDPATLVWRARPEANRATPRPRRRFGRRAKRSCWPRAPQLRGPCIRAKERVARLQATTTSGTCARCVSQQSKGASRPPKRQSRAIVRRWGFRTGARPESEKRCPTRKRNRVRRLKEARRRATAQGPWGLVQVRGDTSQRVSCGCVS